MDPGNCQVQSGSEAISSLAPSLDGQGSPHLPDTSSSGKLTVRLCHHALWRQFAEQQNEMVLTKQGRAMFPFLVYKIQGMDPSALYHVSVEVRSVDKYHWRYQGGRWFPYEEEEDNLPGKRFYEHLHSPNTGAHWMEREISFQKLRLTNQNTACQKGSQAPILLKSLHKYQPRLHIEEVSRGKEQALASSSRHTFCFPDTDFIAVTTYQNAGITRLKIENNPFATGHRGKASSLLQSLQKAPAAGQRTDGHSSPPSGLPATCPVQVQEGPGQDKDCHLMPASQAPSGHLHDSRDSRSATSLALPLTMERMNPETLPRVLPSAGNRSPSLSTCNSSGNHMDCPWAESPKPKQAGTGTEERERLQDQLSPTCCRSPLEVSNLGQRTCKKRCLSTVDSAKDVMASALETREQEDTCLVSSESSGNSSQDALPLGSSHPLLLEVDPGAIKEKMNPTVGNSIQESQPPSELPSDPTDFDLKSALCQLFPSMYSIIMSDECSLATHLTQENCPPSLSTCSSTGNTMDCLWPESSRPQQADTGPGEEERLQGQLCQARSRSPSEVSKLGQRTSKKRCLSAVESANDFPASPWNTREQEEACLVASESSGNRSQETVSEASCCPAVLAEGPAQIKEKMNSTPGNSIAETQPHLEFPNDFIGKKLHSVLPEVVPSISPAAMPDDRRPDTHIPQGKWLPFPSSCAPNVNRMQCVLPGSPKPQQGSSGTEEEEKLQGQLSPTSARTPSDVPHPGQGAFKKRCFFPVETEEDSLASAWTNRTQEDEWLIGNEVIGCISQEAVPKVVSYYPVGMQDDTAQVNGEMVLDPWDSFQVSQPPSEFPFNSNALDLDAADYQCLPSTSPPSQLHDPIPDTHPTQGNEPPSPSSCKSNVNSMQCFQSVNPKTQQGSSGIEEVERLQDQLGSSSSRIPSDIPNLEMSDMDSLVAAWKNWTPRDEWLLDNAVIGCSFQGAVPEGSYYPAGMQDDTAQVNEEMVPNPWDSFQVSQPPSEFPFNSCALDLDAVDHEFFTSTSLPTQPHDPSPVTHTTQGNGPPSPSSCNSMVSTRQCFQSVNPKTQQRSSGTGDEERLQDQPGSSSSRIPSEIPNLEISGMHSKASTWANWTQGDEWLIGNAVIGCNSQEAVPEASYYPAGMQEDTAQVNGEMVLNPWDSFQVSQPTSEFPFNSSALNVNGVDHPFFTSTSLPTQPYEPSPDIPITQGNWPPSPSIFTSNVNTMQCSQYVNAKTQQGSSCTEEGETLQHQLGSSSSTSSSYMPHLEQRASKKRCLTPVDSAKDFWAQGWEAWTQEDQCLIASESSGNSSQEAVCQESSYPVKILQDYTGQTEGKQNPIPRDSILEAQPPSELSFDSDLYDVIHQFFIPCTSPAALPDHTSQNMPIAQ